MWLVYATNCVPWLYHFLSCKDAISKQGKNGMDIQILWLCWCQLTPRKLLSVISSTPVLGNHSMSSTDCFSTLPCKKRQMLYRYMLCIYGNYSDWSTQMFKDHLPLGPRQVQPRQLSLVTSQGRRTCLRHPKIQCRCSRLGSIESSTWSVWHHGTKIGMRGSFS